MNFNLKKYHDWSIDEIDRLMPFERDIYTILTRRWVEEENQKARERAIKSK